MKLFNFSPFKLGRRGIAAVEFALVAPMLLVLFIGTIEVLTLYRAEAKLNAMTMNVAQMVGITEAVKLSTSSYTGTSATITSLNDICQGAILALSPFPATGVKIYIASVTLEPSAANANTPAVTPAYDEWEADSTATSNTTCSTAGGTTILNGTGATAPIKVATSSITTGILQNPCDNAIIVQASLTYPGITGLIFKSHPVLTQTAYDRWSNASVLSQLLCSDCTLAPTTPLDYCTSTSTATK